METAPPTYVADDGAEPMHELLLCHLLSSHPGNHSAERRGAGQGGWPEVSVP